jgi:DNA polymerase (family 10)
VPPPENATIAERLETLASLLDLSGASYYSVRAYRRAAELIRATPVPVAELVRGGRVRELRGIGPSIEARLRELVETGRLAEIEELEGEVQPELVGLGRLAGLGPPRPAGCARSPGSARRRRRRSAMPSTGRGPRRDAACSSIAPGSSPVGSRRR